MCKKYLFFALLGIIAMACNSEKTEEPVETIVHKLGGGAPLELPKSFEIVPSKDILKTKLTEAGYFEAGLYKSLSFALKMNHELFFDLSSDEKMNYLDVDPNGPRFTLNEESIARHIELIEQQTAQKHKGTRFTQLKISHELSEIAGSRFLKIKHKITLEEQTIHRTIYVVMLKENRRSLVFTVNDYNASEADLEQYILAFT